ncbi:MAG TPA: hypothetical protein DEA55_04365 [Rhodospirillaceae bacterium]|nr:hypothetical protein [Rhodospirillaceae bacterium]
MRMSKEFVSAVGGLVLLTGVGCETAGTVARNTVVSASNMGASFQAGFDKKTAEYVAKVQEGLNKAGCRDDNNRYIANDGRKTVESEQAFNNFVVANGGSNSAAFSGVTKRPGIDYVTISDPGVLKVVQSAGNGTVKKCEPTGP